MQPSAAQYDAEQKRKFWGKMIWISAISLALSVCMGIAAPVLGMIRAFGKLKTAGAANPEQLAGDIFRALYLYGSLIAVPFALITLILFIISIIRHRKFSNTYQAG